MKFGFNFNVSLSCDVCGGFVFSSSILSTCWMCQMWAYAIEAKYYARKL